MMIIITITAALLLLTACGGQNDDEAAAQAVEAYLSALVEQDTDTLVNLSCAAWEQGALTDSAAYDGVTARLKGMQCAASGQEGDAILVSCQGEIIATYSGEDRPLPLDRVTYLTVNEGGEWRMCGYK
jgi:hypothetical protein